MTHAMMGVKAMEHTVSIEMRSKQHVKTITISNETHTRVLFEGNLDTLINISLVEGDVLEVIGKYGVLRIDLNKEQLLTALRNKHQPSYPNAEVGR